MSSERSSHSHVLVIGPPDHDRAHGDPVAHAPQQLSLLVPFPNERALESRDVESTIPDAIDELREVQDHDLGALGLDLHAETPRRAKRSRMAGRSSSQPPSRRSSRSKTY